MRGHDRRLHLTWSLLKWRWLLRKILPVGQFRLIDRRLRHYLLCSNNFAGNWRISPSTCSYGLGYSCSNRCHRVSHLLDSVSSSLSGIPGIHAVCKAIMNNLVLVILFQYIFVGIDNSIINPVMANQRGVTFSMTDKWTDPTVALLWNKHYTRIGLWTSAAISRTTVWEIC